MSKTNRLTNTAAAEIALITKTAWSFHRFGKAEWRACCQLLLDRGFNGPETIAIMCSKITRLASDERTCEAGDMATSADLATFVDDASTMDYLNENLDEYVLNIIGEDYVAAEEARLAAAPVTLRLVWSNPNV